MQQHKYTTAQEIAAALGGTKSGAGYLLRCPAHEDSDPSLSVTQVGKNVLVKCFAGCSQSAILEALSERGLWHFRFKPTVKPFREIKSPKRSSSIDASQQLFRQRLLDNLISECKTPGNNCPVDTYIRQTRRIPIVTYPPCILSHPALSYWIFDEDSGRSKVHSEHPAMVQVITDEDGRIIGAQRLYLSPDGRKADVPRPKMLMPAVFPGKQGAIRLCEPGSILAVAEGLETGLAFHAFTHYPVWSTVHSWGLKQVKIPQSVDTVVIAVDLDKSGEGQRSADVLSKRLLSEGKKVFQAKPPVQELGDWADLLESSK